MKPRVILLLLLASSAAHALSQNPIFIAEPHFFTRGVFGSDFSYGDSHGGYGYVSGSEAHSDHVFNSTCDGTLPALDSAAKANVLQNLKNRTFEYLVYQWASLFLNKRPVTLAPPACVTSDSAGVAMESLLPRGVPTDDLIKSASMPLRLRLMKYKGVYSQSRAGSQIYAFTYHDLLEAQLKSNCSDPQDEPICLDLKNQKDRLEGMYPLLFKQTDPGFHDRIRNQLIRLLGAEEIALKSGISGIYTDAALSGAGLVAYLKLLNTRFNVSLFQGTMDQAFEDASHPSAVPALYHELNQLLSIGHEVIESWKETLPARANEICGLDLEQIVQKYPNVVRQTLMDETDAETTPLKSALCELPSFKSIQKQNSCVGVTSTESDSDRTFRITKKMSEYPLGTRVNFTLTKPVDQSQPIQARLSVYFDADTELSKDEVDQKLQYWQSSVNQWYNCMTGQSGASSFSYRMKPDSTEDTVLNCPVLQSPSSVPPVKFNIVLHTDPTLLDGPTIRLHRCYRSEIRSSDCNQVYEFAQNQCTRHCKADSECLSKCTTYLGDVGSTRSSRADSGNMILGQSLGTLFHELGHLMGLLDEYPDMEMPLNILGFTSSIMRNSSTGNPKLFESHVKTILAPLQCP